MRWQLASPATLIGIALWALIPGFIAKKKGRSFWGYYFLSFLITPLLTMIIAAVRSNLNQTAQYTPSTDVRGFEDLSEEEKNKKRAEALANHDVPGLIAMNTQRKWKSYQRAEDYIAEHEKWLLNQNEGKRLELFAEKIYLENIFKGKMISNASFSHCIFDGIDLRGTTFKDCEFSYCHFIKCKTDGTTFPGSKMEEVKYS